MLRQAITTILLLATAWCRIEGLKVISGSDILKYGCVLICADTMQSRSR